MEKQFDIRIGNREFTAISQGNNEQIVAGPLQGCYDIVENDNSYGWLCFTSEGWKCDDCKGLDTEMVDALAEAIIKRHTKGLPVAA